MQIYLIIPEQSNASLETAYAETMASGHVSAVLIMRGMLDETAYADRVAVLRPIAQREDVAVLLDDQPDAVRSSGADGAHVSGGIKEFNAAISSLKPEFIAGAGDIRSRHEAMLRGEAGADYLMFGALDAAATDEDRGLAEWWSDTFEIPGVLADPLTPIDKMTPFNCEFIALGDNVWLHPEGAVAALELAIKTLGSNAP